MNGSTARLLTLPWRGRVGSHERSECDPGWGEGASTRHCLSGETVTPPRRSASTLPLQGRVRKRVLAMTRVIQTHLRVPAARRARGVPEISALERQRARGKPGVRCTRSRACSGGSTRVSHHEFTGNIRLSPRDGFNGLFRALPGDRALLPPSPLRSWLLKNLTPASGCQDHTTSPSASGALVSSTIRVHRIPHPTSVTTAKRPSCEAGWPWI